MLNSRVGEVPNLVDVERPSNSKIYYLCITRLLKFAALYRILGDVLSDSMNSSISYLPRRREPETRIPSHAEATRR